MHQLSGWKYDFASLPHWDVRNSIGIPCGENLLFENPALDMAFLIYSIVEYRMLCCAGLLAVFRNKSNPELVLRSEKAYFGNSDVVFSRDGALAFVHTDIWDGVCFPMFVFDLPAGKFSWFRTPAGNYRSTVEERGENEFVVPEQSLQEKSIAMRVSFDSLEWRPFSELNSVCEQIVRQGRPRGFLRKIVEFIASKFKGRQ